MNLGKISKYQTIAAILMIAVIALLCLFFIPVREEVDSAFDAYLTYKNGNLDSEKCTVSIEGTLKKYLLKNDEFEGVFAVNDVMLYSKPIKIVFDGDIGITDYIGQETVMNLSRTLSNGSIVLDRSCKKLIISSCFSLKDREESANESYRCSIVGPASEKSEASAVVEEFKKRGALKDSLEWVKGVF